MSPILILGAGYTGCRTAAILSRQGREVLALHRTDIDFTKPDAPSKLQQLALSNCLVLHSIPSLPNNADATLLSGLHQKAARVVYISTTGVYGDAHLVDEDTPINPNHPRVITETAVARGPWQSLILRPAAIYGPDRGVHISMASGKYTLLGNGSNYISRIHVEDLANLAAHALLSDITGAYPVADLHPCTSREIADYCASKFHLPPPVETPISEVPESRRNNRKVDGRAIFAKLGLTLQYPSYIEGLAGL